jgi:hypothetical protein
MTTRSEQVTYLAVIDIGNLGGFYGGHVEKLLAERRGLIWQLDGPWPNRRIIGEFTSKQEAQTALEDYLERNEICVRVWNMQLKRKRARVKERKRRARRRQTRAPQKAVIALCGQ